MKGELKEKVARGVAWSIAEKVGTTLLQMGVRIVLLRLLMPADFSVVAILMALSSFAQVIVDSGFSQTLIRRQDPAPADYKSVFVFNIALSLALYALLVALAPWIAGYYKMPSLARLAPVFFLVLPANALCVIQNTLFTRQFRFALLSKVTFAAQLTSGLAAVVLALAGCGVWSIVLQQVLMMAVRAVLLWWLSAWRPRAAWSGAALRQMAPYSFSLMSADLITALYNKIPQLFIGRIYPTEVLGYFDQAQKLKDLPVTSTMTAVQSVTFPALSKIGGDAAKFAESYRQVAMVVAYAVFPMMAGLSAVAGDLFAVLLGEKWMPTVPYLEVLCLAGLFYPITTIAYNVLKVKSDGRIIVRLEVVKKLLMTAIFAVTIPRSVMAVVWGLVAISCCEMTVNLVASLRYTTLTARRLVCTLLPVAAVSAAMYAAVRIAGQLMVGDALLRLAVELATGVVTYVLLSALFRLEAFGEVVAILKKQIARR